MPKHRNSRKLAVPEGSIDQSLFYRAVPLKKTAEGTPATLDEATRSVEIVASTEAPVLVFDWERWEMVPEVLLMSGCQIPSSRQVPLFDTHIRWNTASVIGSCRQLEVQGAELIGRAHYSTAEEAQGPYLKMQEGHLTDYSVGYCYDKKDAVFIPEGETGIVDGRTFAGPVKVVRKWHVKEVSACPIGADEFAKARAATAPHFTPHKEIDMDEKLRKFLESRGLAQNATDEEAWRFLETLNVREDKAPAAQPSVEDAARAAATDAVRKEQERILDIRAICGLAGLDEKKVDEFIRQNKSVEEVRAAAFEHVTSNTPASPGFRATVIADERDKFRSAAEGALIVRCGLRHDAAKLAPGALDLRGYSMVELARMSLRMAGRPDGGDPMQMLGRALTTSDFPVLLGNVANLSLMEGFEMAEETWETWADGSGSVSNFNIHTMARAGESDDLDEIGEEDEYKYGSLTEQSEQYRIFTYGKLNRISRQALINDSTDAISGAFRSRGEAVSRKLGDLAYGVLIANAAMGDNVALFHNNHGNVGTGAALGATPVAEAIKLMGLQKDIGGKRRLNIPARFFLAPKTLEGAAEIFFGSQMLDVDSGSQQQNPYAGNRFTRVYDARLDDDDPAQYYFAGPKGKTVKLFFLNGVRTPYLETKDGWTTDGVEFKTRIDAGAKAVSWKALVVNAGVAQGG